MSSRLTPRSLTTRSLAVAAIAVVGLSACQSNPSAERVARDLVLTETADQPEVQDCMLEVLDEYDLNELGSDATSDNPEVSGPAQAALDRFEDDLAACR